MVIHGRDGDITWGDLMWKQWPIYFDDLPSFTYKNEDVPGRKLWNYHIPTSAISKMPPACCCFPVCRFFYVVLLFFLAAVVGLKLHLEDSEMPFFGALGLLMEAGSKNEVLICVARTLMKPWLCKLCTFYQCTHDLWLEQAKQGVPAMWLGQAKCLQMTHRIHP